jgi:hypothetical protein
MAGDTPSSLPFLAEHGVDAAAHLSLRLIVASIAPGGRQALFVRGRGCLVAGDALESTVDRGFQRHPLHVD